jgi:AcrR family transcriptional regulator
MAIETTAPRTRASERARRREQLLDAADRVVHHRGLDASMDEIAAEAGITKPVLYRHFGDKDGLFEALAERYVEELTSVLRPAGDGGDARSRLAARIDAYLSYVESEPERYRFLLGAAERPRTAALVAEFRKHHVADCASRAVENMRRAGLDADVGEAWSHCVSGMVRAAGIWWLETRTLPRERLVEYLTTFLWDGFSALRRVTAAREPTP